MSKPKIPNYPLKVRDGAWFYVSPTHLDVLKEKAGMTTYAKIPWGQVMRQAAKCGHWDAKQGLWHPASRPEGETR